MQEFHGNWLQAGFFVAAENVADGMFPDGVRFDNRERTFTHCLNSSSNLKTDWAKNIGRIIGMDVGTFKGGRYDANRWASSCGVKTPRSVMIPDTSSAGVMSNAGL